jgi:hypothetical protein
MLIVYFQNLLQNEHYIIIDFQQQELFLEVTQFLTASTVMSEPSRLLKCISSRLYKCPYL